MTAVIPTAAVDTFYATVHLGLRPGYDAAVSPYTAADVYAFLAPFLAERKMCAQVTPVRFLYPGGAEPGVTVRLINYPRFPSHPDLVRAAAVELGEALRVRFGQHRVSVECPDRTYLLGEV